MSGPSLELSQGTDSRHLWQSVNRHAVDTANKQCTLAQARVTPKIKRVCERSLRGPFFLFYPHPLFTVLLQHLTRTEKTELNKITCVRNLISASSRLPPISIDPRHETHLLPPAGTVLASPLNRWIIWNEVHPPLVPPIKFNLRTSEVLTFNHDNRCLQVLPDRQLPLMFRTARKRQQFEFVPSILSCIGLPLVPEGDDLVARLLSTPLALPNQLEPPTLEDITSRELRLFLQGLPEPDRRHGTPAQWRKFWKARFPHKARTIWWRVLHDKLMTSYAFYKRSSGEIQAMISPECRLCDHDIEDAQHMAFLCPTKRSAWLGLLCEFTTKANWTDEELCSVTNLDCSLLSIRPEHDIQPYQLVACGLLGFWNMHYHTIRVGEDLGPVMPASAGIAIMQYHARTIIAQNQIIRERQTQNPNQ